MPASARACSRNSQPRRPKSRSRSPRCVRSAAANTRLAIGSVRSDGAPLRPKGGGDPLIGRVIADRYLILAKLGEGGMGRVYVAEHVKMNRQCAIKVMNPSLMNDSESARRFAREASNAARILHPNVAAVFDYGEADQIVYLVMEYVDGDSLSTILERDRALDPRRAIDIARQIADGLSPRTSSDSFTAISSRTTSSSRRAATGARRRRSSTSASPKRCPTRRRTR